MFKSGDLKKNSKK